MKTCVAIVVAALAAQASAATVDFSAYSNNSGNTAGIAVSADLSATATTFTVTLTNNSAQGTMTSFYFETGDAIVGLGSPSIQHGTGTSFAVNSDTPGGGIHNLAGGVWSGSFFAMARTNAGGVANGMDPGETVTVVFAHDGSFSLDALIAAIASNDIRMAMHYQRWGDNANASEWLVGGLNNDPNVVVVPMPPAVWAGFGMIGLIAGTRAARRRGR